MVEIKLIKGNCLDEMVNIKSSSIDLVLTDPPYNIANFMKNRDTNLVKMRNNFFGDAGWDELSFEEWRDSMDLFFKETNRMVKEGGAIVIFMSLIRMETILKLAEKNGLYYKTTGIWHKKNPMPRNMNLQFINSVEGWMYFINKKKTGTFNNQGNAIHDFIESSATPSSEKKYGGHPTQKPEKVFAWFIELLSKPGDLVLDPFMGSGTAAVVSKKIGRNFIGIELRDEYFKMVQKRILDKDAERNYSLIVVDKDNSDAK